MRPRIIIGANETLVEDEWEARELDLECCAVKLTAVHLGEGCEILNLSHMKTATSCYVSCGLQRSQASLR